MKKAKMTTKRAKNRITYQFTGSLEAAEENAKEELKQKSESQERVFLKWQYDKAKKAYEAYERRIADLKEFIRLVEEEKQKKRETESEEQCKQQD